MAYLVPHEVSPKARINATNTKKGLDVLPNNATKKQHDAAPDSNEPIFSKKDVRSPRDFMN
jgi:hypothetical protein